MDPAPQTLNPKPWERRRRGPCALDALEAERKDPDSEVGAHTCPLFSSP